MDIVCILAGGAGNRFRSTVPKQYHLLNGRPVIEYVIDAAIKSIADEVIVAASNNHMQMLEDKYGVKTIEGGINRNESIVHALDHIRDKYLCSKVMLIDAVCPLITSDLINLYFNYLNEFDAVFTTSDINTSIGRKFERTPINHEDYFLIQSPDAYCFDVLFNNFNEKVNSTSPFYQLPENTNIKFFNEFRDYIKIIYPQDITIAEALLREKEKHTHFNAHNKDDILKLFAKLRRIDYKGTKCWEKKIDAEIDQLFSKWGIYEFNINSDAYTGLVLECASQKFGAVIIKMYPEFLRKRYMKELYIMRTLTNYHQCELLDYDVDTCAMLLNRIIPGEYIKFEKDKQHIETMFVDMFINRKFIKDLQDVEPAIQGIIEQTVEEYALAKECNYCSQMLLYLLDEAKIVYRRTFAYEDKCLLHGDIYFKNALRGEESVEVIDPVGYKDVFVFEYMPFLTYELFYNSEPDNYLKDYRKLAEFFGTFTDISKFKEATFVFLVKQLIPSVYEANDYFKRADGYMELIKILYLDENNQLAMDKFEV